MHRKMDIFTSEDNKITSNVFYVMEKFTCLLFSRFSGKKERGMIMMKVKLANLVVYAKAR